jgi:hypothetical protein
VKWVLVLAFAACQPTASPALVLANSVAPSATSRVSITPCPFDTGGPVEHELFAGCAPAPFFEDVAACPECKPCRVDIATAPQIITYGAAGQIVRREGPDSRLLNEMYVYENARIAEVHELYEGRLTGETKVWRDRAGQLIGTSNGSPMNGMDPHYTHQDGRVIKLDSTMGSAVYTYAGDRLIAQDQDQMGEKSHTTYDYNSDGNLRTSTTVGNDAKVVAYAYDQNHRLVGIGTTTLEWDARDRLIRATVPARPDEARRVYTYSYDCK